MKDDNLPPHLRPRKQDRLPIEQLPAELPDAGPPPPPPPPADQNVDRDRDGFLRR